MSMLRIVLSRSCYLLGLGCLIISLFFPTIAQQMTSDAEVKFWESPARTHVLLALNPLILTIELIDIVIDPDEYGGVDSNEGYGRGGDGYASLLKERTQRLFFSIPISISWFMVWGALYFRKKLSPPILKILRVSGVSMLLAAVILSFNYYSAATLYQGYFHLGLGAYLIVGSFLLSGIGLLAHEGGIETRAPTGDISPPKKQERTPKNPLLVFILGTLIPGAGFFYIGAWKGGVATIFLVLCIVIASVFFGNILYYAPASPLVITFGSAVWATLLTLRKTKHL